MNKTALLLAAKDCAVYTVYSEVGGVFLYNLIAKPALVQLTQMRMSVSFGTCIMARYIVSQADNSRGFDIFIMGMRTSVKAGIIRAARQVIWHQQSGRISQSAICGFLGGIVNALVEPHSPVLLGDTTSLNTLLGDTTNGICNVLYAIQSPQQWSAIMRDKVAIGVLREFFKPIAELVGDQASVLFQGLRMPDLFASSEQQNSDNNDVDSLSTQKSDANVDADKLIPSTDKLLVQSQTSTSCKPGTSSHEHAGQGQSSDCGHASSQHFDVCLAGEEPAQSP